MSVNDVTSGILAPALQVKRLQKREPNQKLWRRSQANKNRCVGIFKRRDIIFNRLHFPILIKFEQIQFTFFHLLRFPLRVLLRKSIAFQTQNYGCNRLRGMFEMNCFFYLLTSNFKLAQKCTLHAIEVLSVTRNAKLQPMYLLPEGIKVR